MNKEYKYIVESLANDGTSFGWFYFRNIKAARAYVRDEKSDAYVFEILIWKLTDDDMPNTSIDPVMRWVRSENIS